MKIFIQNIKNQLSDCEQRAYDGLCKNDPETQDGCKESCGKCFEYGKCQDKNSNCSSFTQDGQQYCFPWKKKAPAPT